MKFRYLSRLSIFTFKMHVFLLISNIKMSRTILERSILSSGSLFVRPADGIIGERAFQGT